ncbi:hypothetical protein TNIN_160251 [Trichonephila inaurata madagascariensis]|uniref:Endonuclease/exonuclease/phosphatase domain-containing protein n=1 Tax=Trichonephila inaurata madagascariensis TaxID=2747483 RepID=A0A8X6Y4D0_9ARAC|nr:hypothetical protein TNIN_160251 [Trichonephila inaurata madagascariensis]
MGDFNAKHTSWKCDVDNRRGTFLDAHINRSGIRILAPPTPTRYTNMKTNWEKFTQNLNVPDNFTLPEAKITDDIDKQVAAFTERPHKAYINASKPLKNNDTSTSAGILINYLKKEQSQENLAIYEKPCGQKYLK